MGKFTRKRIYGRGGASHDIPTYSPPSYQSSQSFNQTSAKNKSNSFHNNGIRISSPPSYKSITPDAINLPPTVSTRKQSVNEKKKKYKEVIKNLNEHLKLKEDINNELRLQIREKNNECNAKIQKISIQNNKLEQQKKLLSKKIDTLNAGILANEIEISNLNNKYVKNPNNKSRRNKSRGNKA